MKFKHTAKFYVLVSLFVVICLFSVMVVLLPIGIHLSAQSWLRDRGLDANIEFVGFNLNSGIFLVENAKGVSASNKGFSLDRLLVEINWRSVFSKQLDVQRIKVEGLTLDLESTDKGLVIAGMQFPDGKSTAQKQTEQPANNEPTTWSAQIQQVELSNIKVCHDNPTISQTDTLTVEQMMKACATLGNLKWQGKIGWSAPAKNLPVTAGVAVAGDLLIEELLYSANDDKQHFAHLGRLSVEKLASTGLEVFDTELVEIANVDLMQHSRKQGAPYLASWQSLKVSKPVFDQQKQKAVIQDVHLSGLKANVEITKTGLTGLPVASKEKQPAKQQPAKKTGKPFTFAINKVTVNGASQASLVDKAVDPVFKESLSNIRLSLADINSAKPEVKSPLSATIKVSEYGEVNIKGTVQPFAEKLTVDLKQDIKNIDLANYNVYGKTFIGHKIHSGQMDLEQKLKIEQGHLDTESTVVLNKFKVESLQGEEAEKYKSDLGIPLSTALSLLRDKNDNIKLTIPVTGDMNAPDFSLNDVISTVTGKVIKEAIISYYTPFGMVKLLGGIVDLATGLKFEPVEFAAGKTALEQQGIDNLSKLKKLLAERPHVQLTFCGHPARSDAVARYKLEETKQPLTLTEKQTSELLALFKTRMENMKKYMVKELKVNPGQVLICSEPDNKAWVTGLDTKPQITIKI